MWKQQILTQELKEEWFLSFKPLVYEIRKMVANESPRTPTFFKQTFFISTMSSTDPETTYSYYSIHQNDGISVPFTYFKRNDNIITPTEATT